VSYNLGVGVTRRDFLRLSSAAPFTTALGLDLRPAIAQAQELKISRTIQSKSTCPYCSVSCGVLIHTRGRDEKNLKAHVVHVEGDPDHPINRGTLCPKGASLKHYILNDHRLTKPQYRAPGASDWSEISWKEAIEKIARKIKETREATFVEKDAQGRTVRRTEGIATIGGCTDTNELNWLLVKTMRSLGLVYLEQQSRI
jgi:formate dehydrogenase major subunit